MAVTKEQKRLQLEELKEKFQKAQSIIFAHYIGLTVGEVSELRGTLRKSNAEMKVAKKTLMAIAAKEVGLPEIDESKLDGAVSCIFSFEDPLSGAQIAFKFAKAHSQVELIGGIFDGKILNKAEATAMATIPSRIELLATFAGMLQSPLRKFMSMSNGPLSGFARGISQMADKGGFGKAPEAPAAPAPVAEAPVEAAPVAEAPVESAPEAPAAEAAPDQPTS